jgi:hypothetical protein
MREPFAGGLTGSFRHLPHPRPGKQHSRAPFFDPCQPLKASSRSPDLGKLLGKGLRREPPIGDFCSILTYGHQKRI